MTPDPKDYAIPFLEQAREDLRAAQSLINVLLNETGVQTTVKRGAPSTFCMLLQMSFEKLVKAVRSRQGLGPVREHLVVSTFLLNLARDRRRLSLISIGPSDVMNSIFQFIRELENAHPQVGDDKHPQLEYPWVDASTGAVCCPARDLHLCHRITNARDKIAPKTLKFATALIEKFDVLYPPS